MDEIPSRKRLALDLIVSIRFVSLDIEARKSSQNDTTIAGVRKRAAVRQFLAPFVYFRKMGPSQSADLVLGLEVLEKKFIVLFR